MREILSPLRGFGSPLGVKVRVGIRLSASSVASGATSGVTVGVLSVAGQTGYTFTETADPDNKFSISGANLNLSASVDFATKASHSVTIQATKAGSPTFTATFVISVVQPLAAPQAVGTLPDLLFNQGSGDQVVQTAFAFSGSGITYSVQSFPTGADLSINASTGALTIGTDALVNSTADGNVVIRATNAFGFAQQSFPLFVVAEQTFTILAREENGTVTVESLAAVWVAEVTREEDNSFTVSEAA